jgi:PAS domain S-box-containing protein
MTWEYAYSQDLWPAMVSVALTVYLGLFSWHRRKVPGARAFAIGCLFAFLWSVGSSLEIAAMDFSTMVFWIKFHALWQLPTVTALSCFFIEYAGFGRFLTRRNLILLSIPALVIFCLMVTDNYHHLIWSSFTMEDDITIKYAVGTWASIVYANLLGIVNFLALLRLAIRSPRSRWPVAIMLFGQISGRVMYVLDTLQNRIFSPGESVFVVIGLSCSAYAFALFYFRVLDPISLARTVVIEQMADGMFVLDLQGHIVDINPAAAKILAAPAADLCGHPVADVMPADSGIEVHSSGVELTKAEISLGSGDAARYYGLSLTNLSDSHGDVVGHLLLLHDITRQKRSQERMLKQQQVVAALQERERLARELHDSIGQVLGFISIQTQAAHQWVVAGKTEKATPLLRRLAEVAQDAHADVRESIISLRNGMIPDWTFSQALQKYLDHYQSSYNIEIELLLYQPIMDEINPEVGVQVLRVIQEALTNAGKHGGAHRVKISILQETDHVQIKITDDGIGFNPDHFEPDADKHFGLMFMRERMAQIGGSVSVDSQPGSGTTVSLDVPLSTWKVRQA